SWCASRVVRVPAQAAARPEPEPIQSGTTPEHQPAARRAGPCRTWGSPRALEVMGERATIHPQDVLTDLPCAAVCNFSGGFASLAGKDSPGMPSTPGLVGATFRRPRADQTSSPGKPGRLSESWVEAGEPVASTVR